MSHYIPDRDPEFDAWFTNFQLYTAANAAALGLTPAQALEIQVAKATWGLSYNNNIAAQNAAMAAKATKDDKRKDGERVIRRYTGFIQNRPETTDAQRRALGITVPDREPTPTDPELIRRQTPEMLLDFGTAQQVTVHVGPYPKDERRNGFIWPATAFELQMITGAVPAGTENLDALAWQHVGNYPHSPALVVIGHAATVTFRARYIDHLNNVGPWGPPESCSVTG